MDDVATGDRATDDGRSDASGAGRPERRPHPVQDTIDDLLAAARRPGSRPPRPDVPAGRPIGAYSDDQLDDVVAWLLTDDVERDDDALAAALRAELGLTRRGGRVDGALRAAVRRARR